MSIGLAADDELMQSLQMAPEQGRLQLWKTSILPETEIAVSLVQIKS